MAIVRLRRQGTILHRESRTFTHRSAALSWAKRREVALEDPAKLAGLSFSRATLAELIRWYIETFEDDFALAMEQTDSSGILGCDSCRHRMGGGALE